MPPARQWLVWRRSGTGAWLGSSGSPSPCRRKPNPICKRPREGENDDRPQDRFARGVAFGATRAARRREGAHAAWRRGGPAAAGAALGSNREGVPLRDRRGYSVPRGSLSRTLAAARLPLHVRARLHSRLPVLLGDRRRLRRLRRAPRKSRRRVHSGATGTAREAAGVQAADGLELSVGVLIRERLQPRLSRLPHPAGMAVGSRRVQLQYLGLSAR